MNLDSKKLLPPSKKSESQKLNADKFLVPVKNIQYRNIVKLSETKGDQQKVGKSGLKDDISAIKQSILSIEKSISKSLDLQKEKLLKDRLDRENKRRLDREDKLEKKKDYGFGKIIKNMPKPKLSFIDWIKRFVLNMFLGYFAVRVIDYLPTIISIASKITPAINFIGWMGKNLLKGLINFIDWGYKAYDATRGFIKQVGGDGAQKQFDSFSKNLNEVLNYTIITALGIAALANKVQDKQPNSKGGRKQQLRDPYTNRVIPRDKKGQYSFSGNKGGAYHHQVFKKLDYQWSEQQYYANQNKMMRRYAERYGRDAAVDKFGKESVKDLGGKYGRSKLSNVARAGAVKLVGKSGAKTVLKFVRPLLKRLPFIGALIDFGISVALDEPLGRAAFSAIGAALLGTIGTGFGGPVGAVLGGLAGDWAGGKLYDILFKGKKDQGKQKVKGKASGGQVTSRGGTTVGGSINRTQKVIRRVPKPPKLQAPETIPGKNIGGEKIIGKVFPEETSPEHISPLRSLKTSSSILKGSGSTLLSQTMAVGVDLAMGQKPTKEFYMKYGKAFGAFVQEMVNTNMEMTTQETARSILAMANGGTVPYNMPSRGPDFGEKVGEMVANSFANTVEKQSSLILNALKIESNKKSFTGISGTDPTLETDDDVDGGGMTEGQWGPLLDLIAGKESGGNYEAMYPSTTLKGATKMTISEVARRATGAVGKYQQLPQYLVNRAKAAGLNPDKDLYSPENQEKIIINVNIKGRGGERWLKGEISDEQFMQGLSQEFASLPNAQGKFYYPGQRSSMTAAKVKAALSKVKKGGYSQADFAKGKGTDISLGKGYGSGGSKIAGELGRYLGKALVPGKDFLRVTEHPEHGGVKGRHSKNSYHYEGRAIDIGAWDWEQPKILKAIAEFNKKRGVKPVELLHAKNEPRGHSDHVHVAYKHGGLVTKPTHALIGETKKPEMVLDPDTTGTMNKEYPGMLAKLNAAKNKKQISEVLNSYASYEDNNQSYTVIMIPIEKVVNNTVVKPSPSYPITGGRSFSSDGLNIETLLA